MIRHKFVNLCLLIVAVAPAGSAAAPPPPGATIAAAADFRFPRSAFVIDVTAPPYNARGDGKADDTAVLQKALDDAMGQHKVVYVPDGTYLVSDTLKWTNRKSDGNFAYGFVWLQGRNTARCVIRLKDGVFTDRKAPRPVMWCGGFGSADWFHNYIQGITFDTGRGNPGAVGLQFYSNNTGALRGVAITSGDGQGVTGLDLGHRDMNGPLLVQDVVVRGFEVGVRCGHSVNSQTFEGLSLIGQSEYGFLNAGQCVSVRRLLSENAVPALRCESPTSLLDARLVGRPGAERRAAVEAAAADAIFARGLTTTGYKAAIADGQGAPLTPGPSVGEFIGGKPTSPFGGPSGPVGLPVEEAPNVPWDPPESWAVAEDFGADPTGEKDSSAAIQKAVDSGATTLFLPGFYALEAPVKVRGKVRRLIGTGGHVDYVKKLSPDFVVEDGDARALTIEHLSTVNALEVNTSRTVVFRSLGPRSVTFRKPCDAYFEDVTTDGLRFLPGQRAWARQLNVENEGTHVTNDGADLWVLGYKTERGGTLLLTKNGGRSEVFGTFSYTTTAGKLAPMFVTEDASAFAFFHEVCYTGDPFVTLIRESRNGVTKVVKAGEGTTSPYVGRAADR